MAQKLRNNRWSGWFKRKPSILRPFPSLRFEELEVRVVPANTYTWTGLGANANWSNPANWSAPPNPAAPAPTGMAVNAEDLVFPAGPAVRVTNNDITGGTFNSLSFSTTVPGAGYTIAGKPLTLGTLGIPNTGFISVSPSSTGNDIQLDATLGAGPANQFFTVNGTLTVSGHLSGNASSSLTKQGIGTLALAADNSGYAGAITINSDSGTLAISNPNALGTTNVGTTVGTNSTVQLLTGAGTVSEPLLLNGPGSNSAGALFNFSGNNSWNGAITLGTGSATAGVVIGSQVGTVLTINGKISDTGAGQILSKEGGGEVKLEVANTYRGLTLVNNGILTVGNKDALGLGGTTNSGTIVNSAVAEQGQLRLEAPGTGFTILDEFLTLNGKGPVDGNGAPTLANPGALTNTNADNTWAGPVTLGSPNPNGVAVTIGTGKGTLTISGVISTPNGTASPSGSSSLTKIDTGELIFNNANTYSCPTFVAQGTLDIRDSKSLGLNAVTVINGATLQLDVEAGIGGGGVVSEVDAHGRNLDDDSVTHDAHRLTISNIISITGMGVGGKGALYSATGINIWQPPIAPFVVPPPNNNSFTIASAGSAPGAPAVFGSGGAAIGVDLDPRAGHPTADASYFINDYSLTVTNNINQFSGLSYDNGTLHKVDGGQLILPVANTYTGRTYVESGWITVQNNRSLGAHVPVLGGNPNVGASGLAPTLQPETFVLAGAAVHLRTLTPASAPLDIDENFILQGIGPTLPYKYISEKGALMNIGGDNVVGEDSVQSPVWFGYIALNGMAGIGVQQVEPNATSTLTVVGMTKDDRITTPSTAVTGGIIKFGSQLLTLEGDGTYSLDTDIREGTLSARNNSALGLSTTGTFTTPETYKQTNTIVASGANLLLDQSIPYLNGGVGSGIQVTNEQLVLNSPGQQIAVAGNLTPAPTGFVLTFQNGLIGPPASTPLLVPGLSAAEMSVALNALPSVKSSEIQTLQVDPAGNFTVSFNGQTTPLLTMPVSVATLQAALLALPSIQRPEIQTVDVLGASPDTFTLTFSGQTTAPIPADATALQVQTALNLLTNIGPGGVTVTSAPISGGTEYTVKFNGGLVNHINVPQMTALGDGVIPDPIVKTTQEGLNGTVAVTGAPAGNPTLFTLNFGGDLAFQNLPQISATGTANPITNTIRDGVNGSVTVSEGIGPNKGDLYTLIFGGDLVSQTGMHLTSSVPNNSGTNPTVAGPADGDGATPWTVSVVAATGSYTLTYTSPASSTHPGATQTTNPIPITAAPLLVQNELNALTNLTDDVGSVTVTRATNVYTVIFGAAHSMDTPLLVATPIFAPLGTPEVLVSGATAVDGYVSEASLVTMSKDNAWRGPVMLDSGARVATPANTRINFFGAIADTANVLNGTNGSDLVKRGHGEMVLAALDSYRGTTWVDEGITTAANSGSFGTTANGTTVAKNAQLQIQGSLTIAGEPLTLQGQGVPNASTMADQWFQLGSAPANNVATAGNQSTSTRITSIATDPTDPNVIYVATAGGGAWKSKDHGQTWVPLFDATVDASAVMYGGSIAVAPTDPNVIYFATGEANGGPNGSPVEGQQDNFAGTGVYKSLNGGATWTLVTGPNSHNPIYGLAVSKLIVDPTDSRRIYVATANSTNLHVDLVAGVGAPQQIANNILASAVAGVYRYDGTGFTGTPDWFNLTAFPSANRSSVVGQTPYDTLPPGDAGPDDDYRIMFPQTNAAWSDIALVKEGWIPDLFDYGAVPGNTVPRLPLTNPPMADTWVLYAALGESVQSYFLGAAFQGVFNAVYRTEDPANAFSGGTGPTWWIGNGTVFPVAGPNTSEVPTSLSSNPIPPPTPPDSRDVNNYYPVGPIVPPPTYPLDPSPGRNDWIKISGVVTRYYNVDPADGTTDLLFEGESMNASIQIYTIEEGNQVDFWSYPSRNGPFGRTGEFLDMQMSGWDGGIATKWTTLNPTFPIPALYGSETANSHALGQYASVILSPSVTAGMVDTTPNVNATVYIGGPYGVYSDQGTDLRSTTTPAFQALSGGANSPAQYVHALFLDHSTKPGAPAGNLRVGNLLVGSDGGVWYDTTGGSIAGKNFTNINGNLEATQFNNASPYPTDFNQALGAANNNGLQQFNGNMVWNGLNLPTNGDRSRNSGDVMYDPTNPLNAYATAGGQLFRTTDGGQSWFLIMTPGNSTQNNSFQDNVPLYVDPLNPARVLVGGSTLQETIQGGVPNGSLAGTFVDLKGGTTVAMAPAQYQGAFVFDPAFSQVTDKLSNTYDPDTIYITDGAALRVTKNRGVTWVDRTPFNDIVYTIEFVNGAGNRQFIMGSTGPVLTEMELGGLEGDEIWTAEATGAPGGTFKLAINGTPTGNIPYGASSLEVQNALAAIVGAGNVKVTAGPGSAAITDVAVDPSNRDTVYITVRYPHGGNFGPVVYRSTDAGQTWTDISGHSSTSASVPFTNSNPVQVPDGLGAYPTTPVPGPMATSTVTVTAPAGQVVSNITVSLNISMTFDTDLEIFLVSPTGVKVQLYPSGINGGQDFTGTTFSDSATTPITAGSPPYTGSFQPVSPLAAFNGIDPNGVWTLQLDDVFPQDIATLLNWTLNVTTGLAVTGNLPDTQVWSAVVDPRTDTLYVGTDQGVWKLPNASESQTYNWTRFGTGMPEVQVHDLDLNQQLNTLTAATYGRSVYQLLLTDYQPSPGALRVLSGDSVWTGPVTILGDTTITADGTQKIQDGIAAASLNIIGTISDGTLGNASTITKSGLGTIVFSGTNTYGGQTLVQQGVLVSNNPSALGLPTANTVVAAGAALGLESDLQAEPVLINGDGIEFNGHNTGALRNIANNNVYTGVLTLGTNTTIGADSGTTLTIGADPKGTVSGAGSITDQGANFTVDKELAGTVVLASPNILGGSMTVDQGSLRIEDANALGDFGEFAGTYVRDGAAIQLSRNDVTLFPTVIQSEPLFVSGTGIDVTGAIRNVRGDADPTGRNDNTWRGPITFTMLPGFFPQTNPGSRVAIGVDDSGVPGVTDTLNIDTNMQQDSNLASFGLIKVGEGRLNLLQANSFTGTTEVGVNIGGRDFPGGSLRIENPNSLGPNAFSNSVQTISVVGSSTGLAYQLTVDGRTTAPIPAVGAGSDAASVQNALNGLSSIGQSDQQRIQVTGTSGTYTLSFNGQSTTLNRTATAAQVQTALNNLTSIRRNETQDILITGTSGFFTLTYDDGSGSPTGLQTTQPIAFNAPASTVQNQLNLLTNIAPTGNVTVTSVATPTGIKYTVTFGGTLGFTNVRPLIAQAYTTATQQDGSAGAPEIQTIANFATTGTFILSFAGQTTVPLPYNATAAQVQTALNNLPSIGGLGGTVSVISSPLAGGVQYKVTFAGTLGSIDVPQISAQGVGGPVCAVRTVQDGLSGSVTVTGAFPNYTVTFGGELGARNLPLITATNGGSGDANATITKLRDGTGVLVSETPSVNGRVFTVSFQNPLSQAVVPTLAVTNPSVGLSVSIGVPQVGGTGAIVNDGAGGSSIEIDGDPTNVGASINVVRNIAVNGVGVLNQTNVTSSTSAGGVTTFLIEFDGGLGNANIPLISALGVGGTTATAVPVQDGSRGGPEIQQVQVSGTAGTFTISLNGATTAPIAFDASASDVQAALNALASLGGASGALNNVSGNNTLGGTLTLASDANVGANPGTTLTIPTLKDPTPLMILDPVTSQYAESAITKVGLGTVLLPNANSYGGHTFVQDGVLAIRNPQAIGTGRSEVQNFTTVGTVGAFSLTFNGQKTVPLAYGTPATGGATPNSSVQNALNALSSVKRSEIQSVQLSGLNTGTFTLSFNGQTTGPLAYTASASTVQSALQALSTIGVGNVSVTGGSPNYTITFVGALANKDVSLISASGTLPTIATSSTVQDGLGGIATVTASPVPGGTRYTVTFGGDLANINLPQLIVTSGMVFVTTVNDGSITTPETQTAETFISGAQVFNLTFNGFTTPFMPAGTIASTVQANLENLFSIRHNEQQDITVLGTSGTFQVTVTNSNGTRTTADQAFNIAAGSLQTALESLLNVGAGNVTVTSTAINGGTIYHVTFIGALGNKNLPQMSATGKAGAVPTVTTITDGLGGDVSVFLTGVPGDFVYTITFAGDLATVDVPEMTGNSTTTPSFIGSNTVTDGNGSETQYIQVTGTNGVFSLSFEGQTTQALLFNASAATVEAALNTLTTIGGIGGSVRVTKAGTPNGPGGAVYTVTFGGTLSDLNVPSITAASSNGAIVNITTGNDGPEGTTVLEGATLQLQGNMVMDREAVTLNGFGFQNQGALNINGGNVTWQAASASQQLPLFLGSDASIGTTLPADNLTFLLPITDVGNGYALDLFGPGTVTYASTGPASFGGTTYTQYTGTTTVHSGLLLLSQPAGGAILGPLVVGDGIGAPNSATVRETIDGQIADTSPVLVNSDGLFDLNQHNDTIGTLTVMGGNVLTGDAGLLTSADVTMVGGTINIGNSAVFNAANVSMAAGAAIVANATSTMNANSVTMNASSISFGPTGILTIAGDLVMTGASTIDMGLGGHVTTQDISLTGGHIVFANNGILDAANVADSAGAIVFGTNSFMNVADLSLTNLASVSMGDNGTLSATGNIFLDHSLMTFATNGILTGLGTLTAQNLSAMTFGLGGALTVGNTTLSASTITMGDGALMKTGNIAMTGGAVNLGVGVTAGSTALEAGNIADNGGTFTFGDNAVLDAGFVSLINGSITFHETGHLSASGNLSLSTSDLTFGDAGKLDALNFTSILSSVIDFLLNGIIDVEQFVMTDSSLSMGNVAVATATSYVVTTSSMTFGNNSTVTSPGSMTLSSGDLTMGSSSFLQVAALNMSVHNNGGRGPLGSRSTLTLGADSTAITGDILINGGIVTVGDNSTINAGNINDSNGDFNLGNTVDFTAGTISANFGDFLFGTDGNFNTSGDLSLSNSTITMGNAVNITPTFTTQNVTMTSGSTITLGSGFDASTLAINLSASSIALGNASDLALGGNITADSTPQGGSAILGPGILDVGSTDRTLNVANGSQDVDLLITTAIASTPTERLIKTGAGRLEFAPAGGFAGPINVQAGDLQVDTTTGPIDLTGASASLSGAGTVGIIDGAPPNGAAANGTVSPGANWAANPAGILHAGTTIWGVNSTYFVNLASSTPGAPTAGTDFDQLQVNGNIFINNAKLDGLFGSGIQFGDRFPIIQATGTVFGKFAAPFGPNVVFIQGEKFLVDYSDPHQVVLQKIHADIVSMSVSSSVNPSTVHQPIIFTVTMTPEAGAGAIPTTSTVTFLFKDPVTNAVLYSGTVNVQPGNVATFDTSVNLLPGNAFLPGGTYKVEADFNGDPLNFNTATATLPTTQAVEVPVFTALTATPGFLSPNQSPGIQDTLAIDTSVIKERGSINWTITITDSSNTVVRQITGTGGTSGPHTSVPISATWDGMINTTDPLNGPFTTFAPDGDYTIVVSFTDQFTNTANSSIATVVVDDTNPTATVAFSNSNVLIAPGTGLSVPETTELKSTLSDPAFPGHPNGTFDHWTMVISNSNGTVRTFTDTNPNVDVVWNGTDGQGNIVPDAAYTVTLTAYDAAGNSFTQPSQTVVVLTHPPTIQLTSNSPTVYGQTITLTTTVSLPTGTPSSVIDLLNGNPVEFFKDPTTDLGGSHLALVGGQYQASITVPTFNAGAYNSIFVHYVGTSNFLPGDSATITHVVTPANLTVTAKDQSKQYGDPVPPLTVAANEFIVAGLVNGDTAATVLSGSAATTATQASPVIAGGYPITQGSLVANSNYTITAFNNGTLTVTKAPLTLIIDDATRPVHAANPPFTFHAQTLLLGDQASVVSGLTLVTSATGDSPVGSYPITATGTPVAQNYNIVNIVPGVLQVTPVPTPILVGPGSGGSPTVQIYSSSGQSLGSTVPFDSSFTGGVRVATGDFNRDGVLDYAFGTGPGTTAFVRVVDGKTGQDLFDVAPFENFQGGVFVSAGDITGDGADDLVITPDQGGGPRVVAYSGITFNPLVSYFGINDPAFRGGARAAVGDLNGDGYADIAISAGFAGGPRISVWDGKSLAALKFKNMMPDFFAFDPSLRNGAYVAIGDVNGDGKGDLITGAGPGGAPHVKIFSGADLLNPAIGPSNAVPFANFFAGDPNNRGGVRVTTKSLDSDIQADLVTGVGDNGGDSVSSYLGKDLANGVYAKEFDLDPFPGFMNGVFVG